MLNFSALRNLGGVVLTELKAIRRTDVEDWTKIKAVRSLCRIDDSDIRILYPQPELVIPMETLADQLRELARKCKRQRGDP